MPTYLQEVTADAPVAYYRLNETSGTTLFDAVGTRNGTFTGTIGFGLTGALRYDSDKAIAIATASGASGVNYGKVGGFPSAAAFSAECWVYFEATGYDGNQAMMELAVADATNTDWLLYYETDRLSWRVVNDAGSFVTITANAAQATGTWAHVVGTYASGTMRLYVNGTQVSTTTITRTAARPGVANLWLGRLANAATYGLNGRLDECAVYNTALSAARVQAHYEAGANQPFTGTVGVLYTDPVIVSRGNVVDWPSSDVPLAYPTAHVSGRVYDNQGASVSGATVLLVRQRDGVTVQTQISGTNGAFLFIRDSRDTNEYYAVAFSVIEGDIQVHGTTNRGLTPIPST